MTASLQFKTVLKSNLFYNKYCYKASCKLPGVRFCHYVKTIEEFKSKIERIRYQSWHRGTDFSIINFEAIEKFIKFKNKHTKDITIRTEHDTVGVYSNDKQIFNDIDFAEYGLEGFHVDLAEPGTITFKRKPKSLYRTYFKSCRISSSLSDGLYIFNDRINNGLYKAHFSRTLAKHLKNNIIGPQRWMNGSYYIDYDQESMTTVLHMMFSGSLGTTYKLVQKA